LATPGAAVGGGVGRGVGLGVGRGVGLGVGLAVAVGPGVRVGLGVAVARAVPVGAGVAVARASVGVGVGPTATITGLEDGLTLGAADPEADGSAEAAAGELGGALAEPPELGASDARWAAEADGPVVAGDELAAAIALGPGLGTTTPAVNATVARMRFSSPIATTRRARCAVVTVFGGLLRASAGSRPGTRPMVASGTSTAGRGDRVARRRELDERDDRPLSRVAPLPERRTPQDRVP